MTLKEKQAYQDKVGCLNNHPANINVDHSAFFTTKEEFEHHINKLEENIKRYK